MKTKLSVENISDQHEKEGETKYEFIFHPYALWSKITFFLVILCGVSLIVVMPILDLYGSAITLAMMLIFGLFGIIWYIALRMTIRHGTGILRENHVELYLHKTKHIIEYQEIEVIERLWKDKGPMICQIELKGGEIISIHFKPPSIEEFATSSHKPICIFQEALVMKIKDKGLNNVKIKGSDLNSSILEIINNRK